jgi:signal transduction histidine kinase/HAMP domain-containing protein
MFPVLFSSLRVRFLLLLLLAVLPGFGLAFYLGFEHRQQFIARAQEEALQLVRVTAAHQERLIEAERQLLSTIAQLPEVLGGDSTACHMRLATLLQQYPRYANLAVVAADGYISCSALPFIPPLSATRRAWYKRVLKTHTFAVGDYQIGRISGKNTITLAYPLLSEANEIRAIVSAALDLDWLNQVLAEAPPPADTTLTLIDPNGTVIARYPDAESWVGVSLRHTPLIRTVLLQETGVADLPDLDNVARLFAFRPLVGSGPTASLSVCAGIAKAAVFAEADRAFVRTLIVLGVVVGLGSIIYWAGADWLILRTLRVLVRTAGEVAAGNLSTRTGLSHTQGELGQLTRAFDEMAGALETRQDEATRTEAALHGAVAQLELLRQVDRAILTAQSPKAIARAALEHICALVSCQWAVVSLFDFQAQEGSILASAGPGAFPFPRGTRLPLSSYGSQELAALQAGQTHVVEDVLTLSPAPLLVQTMVGGGICAYAELPLLSQGELIGALDLWMDRPGALAPETLAIARTAADLLAVAIQQARLHEQVQRHADELETHVSERTAQLQTVNEELEAFSYSVSHDLRAPLRSIDGFSQALLEDYSDRLDTPGQDALRRIRRAAQRMAELIDALLGLARVTRVPLSRASVDLTALATSIVTDLRRREPARPVTFHIADGLTAHADATLLRIAFENLLDNAWKFTAKQDQALIEVGVTLQPNGAEVFFVHDNGAGFDMTYASKLFGAFQRLHQSSDFPGTGIGLATVQRIIHRHGGRIWADAGVGQGATFSFTLSPSPPPALESSVDADPVGTYDHQRGS